MDSYVSAKTCAAGAAIFLAAMIVYLPAMSGGFIWDDDWLVTDNPRMEGLKGLAEFWRGGEDPDYYPMTWSSLWVEYQLWKDRPIELPWGIKVNGYHVSNILMHGVSSVLIWQVLRRLGIPGAWLAGLIFAVHPVNVASVAWISERKNTLSMIFYLPAILGFLEFDSRRKWEWYGLSLGMFVLALLSKTSIVMTPLVLLGCIWWRRGRISRRGLLETAPFFALAILTSILGIWFQTHNVIRKTVLHAPGENLFWRIAAAGMAPWFYIYKALAPVKLAAIYPRWQIDPKSIVYFLPGLLLAGCLVLFWRYRRSWGKPPLAGLAYLLVSLFPVLGFFDMYYLLFSLVADHWQYVGIVGTIALVVGVGWYLASTRSRRTRQAAAAAAAAVVIALGVLTWRHARVFGEAETLWRDNIAKCPSAWMAYFDLAGAVDKKGRTDEAISLYQTCIKLNPKFGNAYVNIGSIICREHKYEEAARYFAEAIRVDPGSAMAHSNLGAMLQGMGRTQEALAYLYKAVELDSRYCDAQANLGTVLDILGLEEQAMEHWRKALAIKDSTEVRLLLASLLAKRGNDNEAVEQYTRIVAKDPNFVAAYFQLGLLRTRLGQLGQARDDFLRVLELKPDDVDAHNDLAVIWIRAGRPDQAVEQLRQALRLDPNNPNANYNLAITLASSGLIRQSLSYYRRAIQAKANWPEPMISLARILACCTEDGVRNGPDALRLAEEACRLTNHARPDALDTLAAAYAELGRFSDAVAVATKALELAKGTGQTDYAADIARRLEAYSSRRPWREQTPATNPAVVSAMAS